MKTRFTSYRCASKVQTLQRSGPNEPPQSPLHRSCRTLGFVCSAVVCRSHLESDDLVAVRAITLRGRSTFEQSAVYQIELPSQATDSRPETRLGRFRERGSIEEKRWSRLAGEHMATTNPNRRPPTGSARRAVEGRRDPIVSRGVASAIRRFGLRTYKRSASASAISSPLLAQVFCVRKATRCSGVYLGGAPSIRARSRSINSVAPV
jgi:hypothetical protein